MRTRRNKLGSRRAIEALGALRRCVLAALTVLALALSGPAQAHRFHAGITDIGFNTKTGSIEIVHTLMTHDVENLLTNLYQRQFDLSQPDDEAVLRKYIEQQFQVLDADRTRLPLRWVGVSVNVERLLIYQEIENTPLARAALLRHAVLSDFLPDQANTVNLQRDAAITTLTFDRSTVEQRLP